MRGRSRVEGRAIVRQGYETHGQQLVRTIPFRHDPSQYSSHAAFLALGRVGCRLKSFDSAQTRASSLDDFSVQLTRRRRHVTFARHEHRRDGRVRKRAWETMTDQLYFSGAVSVQAGDNVMSRRIQEQ